MIDLTGTPWHTLEEVLQKRPLFSCNVRLTVSKVKMRENPGTGYALIIAIPFGNGEKKMADDFRKEIEEKLKND